ncbi:MAG: hypothetical protein RSN61_21305 [Chryseobacterium sp.]|uniref:hypothetical protein n=1 Tax=Chryseobacterium sp. TaxID=1871047 RepID=UPI002FC62381
MAKIVMLPNNFGHSDGYVIEDALNQGKPNIVAPKAVNIPLDTTKLYALVYEIFGEKISPVSMSSGQISYLGGFVNILQKLAMSSIGLVVFEYYEDGSCLFFTSKSDGNIMSKLINSRFK